MVLIKVSLPQPPPPTSGPEADGERVRDRADELLLIEYRLATEVSNHLDTLRNVLTSFFLTLNGGVLVAASVVLKGDANQTKTTTSFASPQALLAGLIVSVALLGTLFVVTIARMRRIQIERYHTANTIRNAVLPEQDRKLVPYADSALSTEYQGGAGMNKRLTGSYLWTLTVLLPSASLAGLAVGVILADVNSVVSSPWDIVFAVVAGVGWAVGTDQMYFRLSRYTPRHDLP